MSLFTPPPLPPQRRPGPPPSITATGPSTGSISVTSTVSAVGIPPGVGTIAATSTVSAVGGALATGTGTIAATSTVAATPASSSIFPLTVSSNGRYLRKNDGTPFLVCADTTWSIFVDIPLASVSTYFSTLVSQGFNAILGNAIEHHYTVVKPPKERSGLLPFTQRLDGTTYTGSPNGTSNAAGTQGQFASDNYGSPASQSPDPTFINNSYWLAVEQILDAALANNLLVFLWPGYLGFHAGDEGWMLEMTQWDAVTGAGGFTGQSFANATKSKMWNYGAWLAARWARYPNIVWTMGGDYGTNSQTLSTTERAAVVSLVAGMKSVSGQQSTLWTAHWDRPCISDDNLISGVTWDINFCYCDEAVAEVCRRGYSTVAKPSVLGEYNYENGAFGGSAPWRKYTWWGFLGGIAGGFYGHEQLWRFDDGTPGTDWTTLLSTTARLDVVRQFAFMSARPWHRLVPHGLGSIGTLVTAGGGTASPQGTDYVAAAATPEGDLLLAYVPPAHTGSITIDMTKVSSMVTARWFDPSNATFTSIGAFANTGTHAFTPPGTNNAGDADFLLVLETPVGTAAATSTATAVGQALATGTGTAAGTSTVAGVGQALVVSTGTIASTSTVTAVSLSTITGTGTAATTSTVAGVGAALVTGIGTSAGTSTVAAVGQALATGTGASAGTSTVAGVGSSLAIATGSSSSTSSVAGVGSALVVATGSVSSTSTVSAISGSLAVGTGSAAGISTVSGVGAALTTGTGTATGATTASGVGGSLAVATGSSTVTGAVTGVGSALVVGTGTASATSTVSAIGSSLTNGQGTGSVTVTSTVAAVGQALASGIGTASAVGALSGVGAAIAISVGTTAGTSTVTAVGASLATGVGTASSTSTVTGVGSSASSGSGTGAVSCTFTVAGVGQALVVATGTAASTSTVLAIPVASIGVGTVSCVSAALAVGMSRAIAIGLAAATSTVHAVGATDLLPGHVRIEGVSPDPEVYDWSGGAPPEDTYELS